ncbi:MAG: hypothetical protein M3Z19_18250 [Chloroflexota bacterium]|nr:hypothetical protein [Chloroflexota bacterium]
MVFTAFLAGRSGKPPHPLSSLFFSLLLPMEEQCPYLDESVLHEAHSVRDAQHRDRISDRFLHRVTPFRIVIRVVRVFRGAILPLLSLLPDAIAPCRETKTKPAAPLVGTAGVVPTVATKGVSQ